VTPTRRNDGALCRTTSNAELRGNVAKLTASERLLWPGWPTYTNASLRSGWQLSTFTRARKNVAIVAMLLDTQPKASTVWVADVYQRLKNIFDHFKAGGQ
jgi:hypothetical protein